MTAANDAPLRLDQLYDLLPAVIRLRDAAQGEPLHALMQVIARQAVLIEDDLDRLYDNWFIETCEDWVVPYIADLIGHAPIDEAGADDPGPAAVARNAVLLPRREVAHTLRWRRRKGTLALLEEIAQEVAGWPAHAVEYDRRLAQTQSLRLAHRARGRSVDLRRGSALRALGDPFDELAHTADLRRPGSWRTPGRYGPASVAVFAWRLLSTPVTRTRAAGREDIDDYCFTFSVLGNDAPLFNRPVAPAAAPGACQAGARVAMNGPLNLPQPITRAMLALPHDDGTRGQRASGDYYGLATQADGSSVAQSFAIWAPGWPDGAADPALPIPAARILVADLDGWRYLPPRDHVAVDPERGRIAFPPRQLPRHSVSVSYHYGFPADIGGGEYLRPLQQPPGAALTRVTGLDALRAALKPWLAVTDADGNDAAPADQPAHAVIEIADSGVYTLALRIMLAPGHTLQLRAAQRTRPVLRLLDRQVDQSDKLLVRGAAGSRFTLDGLLVGGRGVQIQGAMASLNVRHSTLVPGWSLQPNCDPKRPAEPSIEVIDGSACIVIDHSIVGSIQIDNDEVRTDPVTLRISDSVVDATGANCDSPQCEAVGAAGDRLAFAILHVARSTLIGRVMAHAIALAENSLFMGRVQVARRQVGCVRFCYVTPGSRTPRRFHCQPDGVEADAAASGAAAGDAAPLVEAAQQQEAARVRPRFDAVRYGTPTYCRLALDCAAEIVRGADDESEMGVYHDLYQPQRQANLVQRLDEFSPSEADAGLLFAD